MRRYKRTPTNLYGADDYIEKHHIPDILVPKLNKLIFPERFASESPQPGSMYSMTSRDVKAAGKGVLSRPCSAPKGCRIPDRDCPNPSRTILRHIRRGAGQT